MTIQPDSPGRYPLEPAGDHGWFEVQDPEPGRVYEAYRVDCMDPGCDAHWPGTLGLHSHVEETGR